MHRGKRVPLVDVFVHVAPRGYDGFVLPLSDIPPDTPAASGTELTRWQSFCTGGRAVRLAQRVVAESPQDACLTSANIGKAARNIVETPGRWRDWGDQQQVLVHLKDLWLILVANGQASKLQISPNKFRSLEFGRQQR